MDLIATIDDRPHRIRTERAESLAIPMAFDGDQPNHFGAPLAAARPFRSGDFIGDTRRGGSCNVAEITLIPHCNGTHTESVAHILGDAVPVHGQLAGNLMTARLITVAPVIGYTGPDAYTPPLETADRVITREMLLRQIPGPEWEGFEALILRTLPNGEEKRRAVYGGRHEPPFFTRDAMVHLATTGIRHLLVDFPSIDRMHDGGRLTNHRLFWNVPEKPPGRDLPLEPGSRPEDRSTHRAAPPSPPRTDRTITEMIYVPDRIADGRYVLNLQLPAFQSDAAPSRPIIYPLEEI